MTARATFSGNKQFDAYAAELGWQWSDNPAPEVVMLLELCVAVEDARRAIRNHATSVRQELDRIDQVLSAHRPLLNSLGELQQRPAAFECAVGQFYAAERLLSRFMKLYRPHPDANELGCAVCGEPRYKHPSRAIRSTGQHAFRRP